MNLNHLFSPQKIALVGASKNPNSLGNQLFIQLSPLKKVTLYPVNPKYKSFGEQKSYPDLLSIPGPIDQVIVAVPAPIVPEIAKQAVVKKVKSMVVITAGFSETDHQGAKLEKELKAIAKNQFILLGPNCFGYASPYENLNTSFAKISPPKGSIGLISQSGAIGSFLFDWAGKQNLGFSRFASLGNRAGVTENELIDYLLKDKKTKVIALYLESFADGKKFLKVASRASYQKPVIVLFGGQTKAGQKAASSHTASLSPEVDVIATALSQSGCIQVSTLEEFTDLLEVFSLESPLMDNDLVIVTNAGGPGILAADAASQFKLSLSPLSRKTEKILRDNLGPKVVVRNPVDLLGDAMADRFETALQHLVKDKLKDAFLIVITPQSSTELEKTAETIVKIFSQIKKPVVVSLMGSGSVDKAEAILAKNGLATIDFPQQAVLYLSYLYNYYHGRKKQLPYPVRQTARSDKVKLSGEVKKFSQDWKSGLLSWAETSRLANLYQLPLVKTQITTAKNLPSLSRLLGWPMVLKSDPSQGAHRTEVKGLYLNLKSNNALKKAYQQLKSKFDPVLAQAQVQDGVELFVGLKRQGSFPPLLTIGSGGIYTELYKDVNHAFLPLNQKLVEQTLNHTKVGQIIKGVRGMTSLALDKVVKMIINVSFMFADFSQIEELDINPAIVAQSQVTIVDIKIKIAKPTHL